jgi:hypothetical protein
MSPRTTAPKSATLHLRLTRAERARLNKLAKDGETLSDVARRLMFRDSPLPQKEEP